MTGPSLGGEARSRRRLADRLADVRAQLCDIARTQPDEDENQSDGGDRAQRPHHDTDFLRTKGARKNHTGPADEDA